MKKYLNILLTILLIVFQVTVLSRFKIFGFNCNLALVCVIIVAAVSETNVSILNAVLAGIFYDVFACYSVGWHLVMFTVIAVLMFAMVKYMYHGSLITVAMLTALLTVICELILCNFGYLHTHNYGSFAFVRFILPQTVMNTLASFVIFPIFNNINKVNKKYRY